MPFGPADQRCGYWWEISMRQSRSPAPWCSTPRRALAFFEALIADDLDLGRPANIEIIFGRRIRRDTQGVFRTAIDRPRDRTRHPAAACSTCSTSTCESSST
jgi:hypothetical protein